MVARTRNGDATGRSCTTLQRIAHSSPCGWRRTASSQLVALLERAKQLRPSGVTFLQLSMAEAFHAQNAGSWEIAQRAMTIAGWQRTPWASRFPPCSPCG